MSSRDLTIEQAIADEARETALTDAAILVYELAATAEGRCEECLLIAADSIRKLTKEPR